MTFFLLRIPLRPGAFFFEAENNSLGMRRRLDIAACIVVTPDLLFLDEPTTGRSSSGARRCSSRPSTSTGPITWPRRIRYSVSRHVPAALHLPVLRPARRLDGDYLQFLLPEILAQTVVMITMYTGVTINSDIRTGPCEEVGVGQELAAEEGDPAAWHVPPPIA